jgi:protoheme IX farnesyltransferase
MIRGMAQLFRLRLSFLNGIAAVGGVLLSPLPSSPMLLLSVFSGVTLIAAGGSAINQVQEYKVDRLMVRTRQRPVAQGSLSPPVAALLGAALICSGVVAIGMCGGVLPALIGVAGILWYVAVYTPLKTRTPFALVIGALCGALPPVIGWCCSGGDVSDYRIVVLATLLYLWQIPHFWLLQQRHAADYLRAGIPLFGRDTVHPIQNLLFWLWLVAFIAGAMLLPALHILERPAALWYAVFPIPLVILTVMQSKRVLFIYLNFFPVLLTLLLYFRA